MAVSISIKGSTARAALKVISRDIKVMKNDANHVAITQIQLEIEKLTQELQLEKDNAAAFKIISEELTTVLESKTSELKALEINSTQKLTQEKLKMQQDKSEALKRQKAEMQEEKERALHKQEELSAKIMKQELAAVTAENNSEIDTRVAAEVAAQLISQTIGHQEEIESLKNSQQQELEKLKSKSNKKPQQPKKIPETKNTNNKIASPKPQIKVTSQEAPKEKKTPQNTSSIEALKQKNLFLKEKRSKLAHLLVPQMQHKASGRSANLISSLANENMPTTSITDSLASEIYDIKQMGRS